MPYVELLRRELAVAAEAGGDEARALAERLTAPLESAIRLTLLEALSAATAEITRDLAPGSVHLRLSGRDPDFVVALPPADRPLPEEQTAGLPEAPADDAALAAGDRGGTSRINLRLPDDIKVRVEEAAGRERISVNAWLVRAAAPPCSPARCRTRRRLQRHAPRFKPWPQLHRMGTLTPPASLHPPTSMRDQPCRPSTLPNRSPCGSASASSSPTCGSPPATAPTPPSTCGPSTRPARPT